MPFADKEGSRHLGQPIELFLFRWGSEADAYYAYTNAEEAVEHQGIQYNPIPINRTNVRASGNLDKANVVIHLPRNERIGDLFTNYPPGFVVTLTIFNGHVGEVDFPVAWVGRVTSFSRRINETRFECEPASTSLKRTGLRRHYQYGCPHVLYGEQCGVDEVASTISSTVVSVNGARVTLPTNWVTPANAPNYISGMAKWLDAIGNLERRSILRIENDKTLLLSGHVGNLKAGDTIDLTLGCNRQMSHCADLHNNIHNFGGCPWIPTKNPIKRNNFS